MRNASLFPCENRKGTQGAAPPFYIKKPAQAAASALFYGRWLSWAHALQQYSSQYKDRTDQAIDAGIFMQEDHSQHHSAQRIDRIHNGSPFRSGEFLGHWLHGETKAAADYRQK